MKKKFFTILLLICLVVPCAFLLSACKKGGGDGGHSHTWGEWQVETDATCEVDGKKIRRCLDCGGSEEQTIPAGHDWVAGICSKCGEYNPDMDTSLSDGRELTNIGVSKTGLLGWTGLKVASKYVLTLKDSSGQSHTYTITPPKKSIDLANLSDGHVLDFGKNELTLQAYEIDSVKIDGQTYEEEIPITTAKDTFTVVNVNSGYSIVRKTYSDEYVTMKNFDSVTYHDDIYGDYLLYEQAGKKGSKYIANKTTFSLINNITTVDPTHSFKIYLSEEAKEEDSAFEEDEKIKMLGGESQWIYIDILDANGEVVKSYTSLLYCTRPLNISVYKVERATPDEDGDIVVTQTELDIGEFSVTENNILNINALYDLIPAGMLIRDVNYNIYERNTDYNTKDMPISGYSDNLLTPGEITLYVGKEDEVRELSAEVAQFADTFTLDYYVGSDDIPYWEIVYNDNHNDETIVVPARIIGHEVHLKTYGMSFYNSSVEHIILESGIKQVPQYAFKYCTKLSSIKIPNTVTSVGAYLFASDLDLTIYLEGYASQGVYHASWCAYGANSKYSYLTNQTGCCSTITKDGVTYSIKNSKATVVGTTGDKIVIPETIKFGSTAYPVKEIESFGNSSFTSLVLSKSVISIPESELPSTLATIEIDDENSCYAAFANILYKNLKVIFIPNGVTELKILEDVTIIDSSVFGDKISQLSGVETIYVHKNITDIDLSLFENHNIKAYVVDEDNTVYSSLVGNLYNKDKTQFIRLAIGRDEAIVIPSSVTSFQKGAFKGYSKSSLTLPFVGGSATENQYLGYIFGLDSYSDHSSLPSTLSEVEITSGTIGDNAFNGCNNLTSVTIGENVTAIGDYSFNGCGNLTEIEISNGVTSIGSYAFKDCVGLTSVTIGTSVQTIGEGAFDGCTGFTAINFNASSCGNFDQSSCVFSGKGASSGCVVTIGEGVTQIPAYLFYGSKITSVTIPSTVTSIGTKSFANCKDLTGINFNASSCGDVSSPQGQFDNAGRSGDGITVIFGEGVTQIPAYLFDESSRNEEPNITSVTIPSTVKTIGNYAFADCIYLTEINFNATIVGNNLISRSFENAGRSGDGITVIFGEGVTQIPAYLFYVYNDNYAPKVTSVMIPSSVESIGKDSFSCCKDLKTVFYGGTENEWNNINVDENNDYLTDATRYYYVSDECICEAENVWAYDSEGKVTTSGDIVWTNGNESTETSEGSAHATCPICGKILTKTLGKMPTITNDASNPWTITDTSAMSTNKEHNSSSTLTLTANGDCIIRISYKTSCQQRFDKLTIMHGETKIGEYSGTTQTDFTTLDDITLSAGDTITFTYSKDGSTSRGYDRAQVKWEIVG